MKNSKKIALLNLGLTNKEINAIETLPDLLNDFQRVIEHDDRSTAINEDIRSIYELTQEIAILRQTVNALINGEPIPEAFATYNKTVEEIKKRH